MLESVRKLKPWVRACQVLGGVHWDSFPTANKESWKREHFNGFVSKLARLPVPRNARCVVDVGANVGTFAAAALSYCPQSTVWAIEPSAATCAEITRFIGSEPRLKVLQCAMGDKPGTAELRHAENPFSSSLNAAGDRGRDLLGPAARFTGVTEQVAVITLDQWAEENKIESIDLLKIDVEGFEPQVIAGAKQTLQRGTRQIIIEISLARLGFDRALDLLKQIESCSFTLLNLDDITRSGVDSGPCIQFDAWFQRR